MNCFIVYKLLKGGWFTTISIYCEPVKYGTDPASMEVTLDIYFEHTSKLMHKKKLSTP